jgi:hypothetical protein
VIEAMDHIGGNAVWSTAYLTFVDSEMQRRAVIADDEETFVADARSIVEQVQDRFSVEWDEELLRLLPGRAPRPIGSWRHEECGSRAHPETETALDRPDGRGRRQLDAWPRVRAGLRGEALVPDTAISFTLTR